ncbi:DNA cytosine methyltransferase [Deinococcus pimensis]|uniref:DNA cytosine methyltransferase n=1 Tax=Deinococcus pimensis TaxID=309888 RepID=UPI0004AF5CEA|nr:DNA cytosine methyltransferase [Deinococcus pimensis]
MKRAVQPEQLLPLFTYLHPGKHALEGKLIVDLFAGGGGVSLGIEHALGRSPDVAVNHDEAAVAMHQINHPYTRHYREDVFEVDPREATGGKPVALLWLSPDCKHHSRAKGGKPVDRNIRSLAWVACRWAGQVRPDVIILENVPEFAKWTGLVAKRERAKDAPWPNRPKRRRKPGTPRQNPPRGPVQYDEDGCMQLVADKRKSREGRIHRAFVRHLERLGYVVESRVMRADRYGVPTIRERFFLIARCDGQAIRWPEPTHGPGLLPVRTAAECIDWSIPVPSIFDRARQGKGRKDLEPATLRRIAKGIDKFVLGERRPFIAPMSFENAPCAVDAPAHTVTTQGNKLSLVTPYLTPRYGERDGQAPRAQSVEAPLPTVVTSGNGARLAAASLTPVMLQIDHQSSPSGASSAASPLTTITAKQRHGVAAAHITKYRQNSTGLHPEEPLHTVCGGGDDRSTGCQYGVVSAFFSPYYGGGNDDPNRSVEAPAGTVTAQDHHALVTATLVQYNGTTDAKPVDEGLPTASTRDRFGLVTGHVLRQYGTSDARDASEPLGSLTTNVKDGVITTHAALALDDVTLASARRVFAFLETHCPAALDKLDPADRAARLVTLVLDGEKYVLWDIGMRMLEPRELYRCQGFPDSYVIDFLFQGRPLSKAVQVEKCGNSVPPGLVTALVEAQFTQPAQQAAD